MNQSDSSFILPAPSFTLSWPVVHPFSFALPDFSRSAYKGGPSGVHDLGLTTLNSGW